MQYEAFAVEAELEASHWWFVGRRALFARRIGTFALRADAPILDVGTSTGTNLRMLHDMGMRNITGLDSSKAAIGFCRSKGLGDVRLGDVCALPFDDASFDLVLATDVIEHVDDDGAALGELLRVLRPGGRMILTVPAFQWLWGIQDDIALHKRRYTMKQVEARVNAAGFAIRDRFYFNYILFLPIFLARRLMRLFPPNIDSENQINSPLINKALTRIFALDVASAPRLRPPFGVSIFMTLEKPQ